MPTLDKVTAAERQLSTIVELIGTEGYAAATLELQQLQQDLQQFFADQTTVLPEDIQRLEKLVNDFSGLVSTLSSQRQQIKDSIGKIAAVKSANKISKTYKTD